MSSTRKGGREEENALPIPLVLRMDQGNNNALGECQRLQIIVSRRLHSVTSINKSTNTGTAAVMPAITVELLVVVLVTTAIMIF